MQTRSARWTFALGLACVLAWPGLAGSTGLEWFPLEQGTRLHYELHRDRTAERVGEPLDRQFFHGRSQTQVLSADDAGRIQVRLLDREREASLGGSLTNQREQLLRYSTAPGAVLLHGYESPGSPGAGQVYDPPLVFLREPLRAGQRWRVGTLRERGLRVDAKAQVMGFASLVVGGRKYEDALHVRFAGKVAGSLTTEDGALAVEEGTYKDELWLARGIGPVRQITSIELRVLAEDEQPLRIFDHVTRTLDAASAKPPELAQE